MSPHMEFLNRQNDYQTSHLTQCNHIKFKPVIVPKRFIEIENKVRFFILEIIGNVFNPLIYRQNRNGVARSPQNFPELVLRSHRASVFVPDITEIK